MRADRDRKYSSTLPALDEISKSRDSPNRQLRSMSVAFPEVQTPVINHPGKNRPRTNSLPNPAFLLGFSGPRDPRTCSVSVRSFTTTPKGVVNAGDIKRKASINSLMHTGSAFPLDDVTAGRIKGSGTGRIFSPGETRAPKISEDRERAFSTASTDSSSSSGSHHHLGNPVITSTSSSNPLQAYGANQAAGYSGISYYRVVIQGDEGVGKTALTRQFSSSEYMGTFDTASSTVDGELTESTVVPVVLDGEESMMEFIDQAEAYQLEDINVDAYIVVFSLVDRNSYTVASDLVRQLRVNVGTDRAIVLVGNKSDIVRKRHVFAEDARTVATTYDCKYIETSAALNHQVDSLVAGTLSLIRQQLQPHGLPMNGLLPPPAPRARSRTPSPVSFFNKIFRRNSKAAASREGIFMQ